jgi:hypothetical protein
MKTIAIMQPYFLPYIGYFQLMSAVDVFVFYDDVTYIKQGWVNRNRVLVNGEEHLMTLQLKGASSYRRINEIEVGNNRGKLLKTLMQAYGKAAFFKDIEPLLCLIFQSSETNLSQYIIDTHKIIASYLGIETEFVLSSQIEKNEALRGQDKVIEICKKLDASCYINSSGGQDLYSRADFSDAGLLLRFIESSATEYSQNTNSFIPWLSIIDVMMFNPIDKIQSELTNYKLI